MSLGDTLPTAFNPSDEKFRTEIQSEDGDLLWLCADTRRCNQVIRGLSSGAASESSEAIVGEGADGYQIRLGFCLGRA